MVKSLLESLKDKLREYTLIREVISLFIIVGVLYFGVKGILILGLQTSSPMRGVTLDSMTHPKNDNYWRIYYEDIGYDTSNFPFQGGIQPGDLVILKGVHSLEDVQIGDVIVWKRGRGPIIHRVAVKDNDGESFYFRTRSDKYQVMDRKIRVDDIVGEVIFSIPYLGYPSTWL